MVRNPPYLGDGYRSISGRFRYGTVAGTEMLEFHWDGAAIGKDGSIVLVESELTKPVMLHVQGHVARAAFMVATGDPVRKLIWIVKRCHFPLLWSAVEPWRIALKSRMHLAPPPCEYWTPEGDCLAVSLDHR